MSCLRSVHISKQFPVQMSTPKRLMFVTDIRRHQRNICESLFVLAFTCSHATLSMCMYLQFYKCQEPRVFIYISFNLSWLNCFLVFWFFYNNAKVMDCFHCIHCWGRISSSCCLQAPVWRLNCHLCRKKHVSIELWLLMSVIMQSSHAIACFSDWSWFEWKCQFSQFPAQLWKMAHEKWTGFKPYLMELIVHFLSVYYNTIKTFSLDLGPHV